MKAFHAALLSLTASTTTALAQVPATDGPEDAAASGEGSIHGQLTEVIVTAQRRTENLQNAPLAVSVISASELTNAGVRDVMDLTKVVPALQISRANGPYTLFYIRGIGTFIPNPLADAAIAFNVDGVYLARPFSPHGSLYDLERVEVLKGPQGTLYGRNATGGAINVITRKPEFGAWSGDGELSYGNHDAYQLTGGITMPMGEEVALRAAVNIAGHDGYLSDGLNDDDSRAGRLTLRANIAPSVRTTTTVDYFEHKGDGVGGVILYPDTLPNFVGLQDPRAQAVFTNNTFHGIPIPFTPPTTDDFQSNEYWGASSTIEWSTPAGTLTVIPAYRESKLDFLSSQAGFFVREQTSQDQTTLEARFATSTDAPLQLLVGAFGFWEDIEARPNYDQDFFVISDDLKISNESFAGFGQLTFEASDTFRITAGGRYTGDKKSARGALYQSGQTTPRGGVILPPAPTFTVDETESWDSFTWKVGVDWDVAPRSLLYASVGTGYKAGGFYVGPVNPQFKPEKVTAYTVGSKNRFLDNRLQLNAELFYLDYKDQQIAHLALLPDGAGGVTLGFPTENIGEATNYGVDLDARWLVTPNTSLGFAAQYLHTKYDRFRYTLPDTSGLNGLPPFSLAPPTGCDAAASAAPFPHYEIDCSGRQAIQSPEWVFSSSLEQTLPLANGGSLVGTLRSRYESSRWTSESYVPMTRVGDNTVTDILVTYHFPGERFSVTGFVNNLEDDQVVATSFPYVYYPVSDFVTATVRPPRTYGLRLNAQF